MRSSSAKKLVVQALLILTDMHQKGTSTTSQRTVVSLVKFFNVLDGRIYGWRHNAGTLRQIVLLQVRHKLTVFLAVLHSRLYKMCHPFHLRGGRLIFSVIQCKRGIWGLQGSGGISYIVLGMECSLCGLVYHAGHIVAD